MITPETIDTGLIRRTMRAIPYEGAKTAVTRFINETVPDSEPNSWDLSFEDYVEAHKSLGLLFCRYSSSTVIIFAPSDRHGIWEMQREESNAKGILPEYAFEPLYRIAEERSVFEAGPLNGNAARFPASGVSQKVWRNIDGGRRSEPDWLPNG
jgi:hypothetical protein